MSDADHLVFPRDFEGEIIERFLAKSIQVWIPGRAGSDVVTSFSSLFQHLVARVLDVDGLFLAERRRSGKDRIERTIFFAAFLNKIKILALLVRNPRDSQIR